MKHYFLSAVLLLIGTLGPLSATAQDNTTVIKGEVHFKGKYLSGVLLKLFDYTGDSVASVRADMYGDFKFSMVTTGDYEIRIDSTSEYYEVAEVCRVTIDGVYVKIYLEEKVGEKKEKILEGNGKPRVKTRSIK